MKRKKALIYTVLFLVLIIVVILILPLKEKPKETQEQLLKFKEKDSYTFTKTDETITFLNKDKGNYLLSFDAKVENSPATLIIHLDNQTENILIDKNTNYNVTLKNTKENSLLEISLKDSKATPNIENVNGITGEHLHKNNEKISFIHDIDNIQFTKDIKKNYKLEFKAQGEETNIPTKVKLSYSNISKNIEIKGKDYNTTIVDLKNLEGKTTFKFEPISLIVKKDNKTYYQIINIKDIKIIKPSGDKKTIINNIKLKNE